MWNIVGVVKTGKNYIILALISLRLTYELKGWQFYCWTGYTLLSVDN